MIVKINNGDTKLSIRQKINQLIDAINRGISSTPGAKVVPDNISVNDAIVIFINGQSNADGNAEDTEAAYSPILDFAPNIHENFANTKIWNGDTHAFENLQVGVNNKGNSSTGGYTYGATLAGAWDNGNPAARYNIIGLASEYGLASFWKESDMNVPLYIIKYAVGGTKLETWLPGTAQYTELKNRKDAAFAALAGKNIRVMAFFRNQGEADSVPGRETSTAVYLTQLNSFYTQLQNDGFFTSETKIIEAGTPVDADGGTPYSNVQNPVKQQFVAADTVKRRYLPFDQVALEHDEIHWNLATQYLYGDVLIPNLAFGLQRSLPAAITPPAPSISYNPDTNVVTVTPPSNAWPQKEFYYTLNGSTPKRLTTTFSFSLAQAVYAPGTVKVYSRAVPGRNASPFATNAVTWQMTGVINTNLQVTPPSGMLSTDPDQNIVAISNSPGAITYASSDPTVFSIVNGAIHPVGHGTATLTVSQAAAQGFTTPPTQAFAVTITSGQVVDYSVYRVGDATFNNGFIRSSSSPNGNAGASATKKINSGRFTLSVLGSDIIDNSGAMLFGTGLNTINGSAFNYDQMFNCMYHNANSGPAPVVIYESGVKKYDSSTDATPQLYTQPTMVIDCPAPVNPGDQVFPKYYVNGVLKYTSLVAVQYPLFLMAGFIANGLTSFKAYIDAANLADHG